MRSKISYVKLRDRDKPSVEYAKDHLDLILTRLRDHPQMKYKGASSWPPQGMKFPIGEEGILKAAEKIGAWRVENTEHGAAIRPPVPRSQAAGD